ncbi:glycoside hydrolase family 15 protein [Rhizobium sp. 2YAF20]|uniref:glycoside hydrolase family 15 protein n=1 Tax=Rhizobium sp. 2YAF20 TaxID=3233027 RepID=UPI003F99EA00
MRIEDYAVIGNCETMALVGKNGSIDWLGLPRFDSAACFAALLGDGQNGRWVLAPDNEKYSVTRRYRGDTLVLETVFETETGVACVIDLMTTRDSVSDLTRIVRGLLGRVAMRTEVVVRFEYGSVVPWVSKSDDGRTQFIAGPNRIMFDAPMPMEGEDMTTVASFDVATGAEFCFTMSWTPSFKPIPSKLPGLQALQQAEAFWSEWASAYKPLKEWTAPVLRSLLTLKGLSSLETGGIVAAATTSLPEKIGGPRNWDYRFCWLRDATFTLYALIGAGFLDEAEQWRDWLLRAVAGDPDDLQIMYGIGGERRLAEYEAPWLAGYEGSQPVHIGNAAAGQIQLDVYGEVLDAIYVAKKAGMPERDATWPVARSLVQHLATIWSEPDDGIWEVRGGRRQFVHSKVMAWVAIDRAVRMMEEFGMEGPLAEWRTLRDEIHAQVCEQGFSEKKQSFVQSYGSEILDASLLLIPMVGFLPPDDPRVIKTLAAVEQDLVHDGLVMRYDTGAGSDGLPPGEGAFLACSFWLVDNYVLQRRYDEARTLFETLLSLANDVGLLSEEYDMPNNRQLGNFPQAFSHLALINSAYNLVHYNGPVHQRSNRVAAEP